MASKKPLVLGSGRIEQLQDGDTLDIPGVGVGRIITASGEVTMTGDDGIVEIAQTVPAACIVNLPDDVTSFLIQTIKDGAGNCETYPITLTPPDGILIDGETEFVLQSNWGSVGVYFNGTDFRLV